MNPDSLAASEPLLRLVFFLGIFAVMALWEVLAPRRAPRFPQIGRAHV